MRLLPDGSDKVAAHANRARVYRNLEDWPAALADLDYVQEHAPAFDAAYAERAFILLMQGHNDDALVGLDRAIALLPDGPERAMASEPEFQPAHERCAEVRRQLAGKTTE